VGACGICAVYMGKGFAKANALDAVIDWYRFAHTGRAESAAMSWVLETMLPFVEISPHL